MQIEPIPALEPSKLRSFFKSFAFSLITVSVQPEAGEASEVPRGTWFSNKNRVRAMSFDIFFTDKMQEELINCQAHRCAIYFMINQGDGVPKDPTTGILNCGRNENVTSLRALCIDTDSGDVEIVKEKLEGLQLAPHYIIESSPNKFHIYFLINPEDANPQNIQRWRTIQHFLANLTPGLDSSVAKECQVLRLPGFFNLKPGRNPFKVSIRKVQNIPYYDLNELYLRLNGQGYDDLLNQVHSFSNGEAKVYQKYVEPVGFLKEGNRRKGITSYIEHVMENQIKIDADDEIYHSVMDGYIRKKIEPHEQAVFLDESSPRRQNLKQYIKDQIKYRQKKQRHYEEIIEHHESVTGQSLPDNFYLNFPGDLGKITRELHDYAPFLSLEMCFAGALCISGMIKGDVLRYEGAWPYINGIVIAGAGAGKSTLRNFIEKVLTVGGFKGKFPKLIKIQSSAQSLHKCLYAAGGAGCLLIDEAGEHLQTITSKNAPAYAKTIRSYYKNASTGSYDGHSLHPGGSLSFTIPEVVGSMAIF